jgi:hypothetical protein
MQRLPHTTCPDPFHHAHSMEEQDATGVEITDRLGDWLAIGFGCRTCGFQSMRRVTQTWLDKVKVTCPGCDAIRLDWDDAPELCEHCELFGVRTTWVALQPNDLLDEIFPEYPNLNWTWGQLLEAMR